MARIYTTPRRYCPGRPKKGFGSRMAETPGREPPEEEFRKEHEPPFVVGVGVGEGLITGTGRESLEGESERYSAAGGICNIPVMEGRRSEEEGEAEGDDLRGLLASPRRSGTRSLSLLSLSLSLSLSFSVSTLIGSSVSLT
jgi:hypothetical protein